MAGSPVDIGQLTAVRTLVKHTATKDGELVLIPVIRATIVVAGGSGTPKVQGVPAAHKEPHLMQISLPTGPLGSCPQMWSPPFGQGPQSPIALSTLTTLSTVHATLAVGNPEVNGTSGTLQPRITHADTPSALPEACRSGTRRTPG